MRYRTGTQKVGIWYPKGVDCVLIGYFDSYFAGCTLDTKSISCMCLLLGNSLVSWNSKKQASVAISTTEAEYVVAESCCAQIIWMKQQLNDYSVKLRFVPIKCDITSSINLTKNLILHYRDKHIDVKHHFIRDDVEKGECILDFVDSYNQLATFFTQSLPKENLHELICESMCLCMHLLAYFPFDFDKGEKYTLKRSKVY